MSYLKWISDQDLLQIVEKLLDKASDALKESEANFTKNVVDPFSAIFQISGLGGQRNLRNC